MGLSRYFMKIYFLVNSFSSPMPKKTVLLGVDCTPSSNVPLIIVQEPTMIGADEMAMPMDTLPLFDQVLLCFLFFCLFKTIILI
jgi:hypothetical protein